MRLDDLPGLILAAAAACAPASAVSGAANQELGPEDATRFAQLALDCVHREYPNKISHLLRSEEEVAPPCELTPAFCGCFDWHSSVHGHWLLARVARATPGSPVAEAAKEALAESLTDDNLAAEVAYLNVPDRTTFERPYGLAWLLQLVAELDEWGADDIEAAAWRARLRPLEDLAADRFADWLPKLAYPIRTGEHSQTAFAFGLVLDWARTTGRDDLEQLLVARSRDLYRADRDCPLAYEPSGQDFLSPCLAEADLMRRVLPPEEYTVWLGGFLPQVPLDGHSSWLPIGVVTDRADGKLAHLDGLNLSRAWMLDGIASALPFEDPRRAAIVAARDAHADSALAAVSADHYEGGHWLGSFATYLVTRRGIVWQAD